jgi:hypothetical protein
MNTARTMRTILSALPPEFGGAATGCAGTTTGAGVATEAPQALQD